ncbi:MAG: hypothetical protein F6J98_18340 [Moorea sp. SIO4G2]|nr:hypothetical protein [Moorena sp. SIO4G2]
MLQGLTKQPWPLATGARSTFNQTTFNLGLWPRVRVQPNNLQPWPLATRSRSTKQPSTLAFGHAFAFNQPWPIGHGCAFNIQPNNIQHSTKQHSTFNQTTFNIQPNNIQPSTKQHSTFNQTTFNL